jgi:hypothetical protein
MGPTGHLDIDSIYLDLGLTGHFDIRFTSHSDTPVRVGSTRHLDIVMGLKDHLDGAIHGFPLF